VLRTALLSGAVWVISLAAWSTSAAANHLFNLDPQAAGPGNVIEDGSGTAYVGWIHKASSASLPSLPMFCKIPAGGTCTHPITLPIPGATSNLDEVSAVFPVFGAGSTIYVVGPRYVDGDVIVWTSTNGGESFNAGTVDPKGYSDKTNPSNALLTGTNLVLGASNPGPGFSSTPAAGGTGGHFGFESPGEGGVAGSDLGLDSSGNPIEAYWNLSTPATVWFYNYKGSGSLDEEKDWEGPHLVTNGEEPRLASGAGGLFMASVDYGGGSEPNLLDVRKYGGTSFGAPLTLTNKSSAGVFLGGSIAESTDGSHVAVVWPAHSSGNAVMDLFTSTNGGASFAAASAIAPLGNGYANDENEVAIGNNGQGWLAFLNSEGLQIADLNPSTSTTPETPPTYKGKTHSITKSVEGNLLTLKVPGMCLESLQPFYVGVGQKARHRIAKALRTRMKVVKVTFSFDGKKKTLKKKPYRWLITPGPLKPGVKYTVKARVTALVHKHGHKKRVVRTLKGQVSAC
jgi:hypothetical protein